jgi:tetratricopeptide (TPR) repeat protein
MTTKRTLWLGAAGLAAAVLAVGLFALPKAPEWTTSSPEALAELQAAMSAGMKLYHADARRHLERALELDPNFVAAKVLLADELRPLDRERSDLLYSEVAEADVKGLRPRERLLVERVRVLREHKPKEAEKLVDDYLAEHPDDPVILNRKANMLFTRGDLDDAEKLYRRLLEIDPNQVIAYNQLGYITMIEGRFSEAEEYFTSYRFIAPDQANPHDSLGELYIIQGRYDEAETSLERALQIKPDFWDSYAHLLLARGMNGDFGGADQVVDRMASQPEAPEQVVGQLRCSVRTWQLMTNRRWADILAAVDQMSCLTYRDGITLTGVVAHRAACELGEWKRARDIEAEITSSVNELKQEGAKTAAGQIEYALGLLEGTRLALEGRLADAAEKLHSADEVFSFRESSQGILKLRTRLILVEVLRAEGQDEEAATLLEKVRAVNPSLVADFERAGSEILGLKG